ncbi:hypothetical protein BRC93_00735 [Halobacteriales archaeon QS_5_70_15]|nr:MAG: hypothetical protein BRC93_00735 [Halobacteriales archaeon QS_5_70_15]
MCPVSGPYRTSETLRRSVHSVERAFAPVVHGFGIGTWSNRSSARPTTPTIRTGHRTATGTPDGNRDAG